MVDNIAKVYVYDKYNVVLASFLTDYDRKLLTRLYQPLCGYGAISLYFTLWSEFEKEISKTDDLSHRHLFETMQINAKEFETFRNRLEGLGLLKTYLKDEEIPFYIYELYAPLSAKEFFRHELLGTLIKQKLDEEDYKRIKSTFVKSKEAHKEYINISHTFADVYNLDMNDTNILKSVFNETTPLVGRTNAKIESNFNLDLFLLAIKQRKIKKELITKELIDLMNSMINLYKLDENDLGDILLASIDSNSLVSKIDLELFKKKCSEYKKMPLFKEKEVNNQVEKEDVVGRKIQMLDELEPFEFLKIKQGNKELSVNDTNLLEDLSIISKLSPGVINVLIDYVMIKQNNTLPRPYVMKIASSLVENNIKSTLEAINYFDRKRRIVSRVKEGGVTKTSLPHENSSNAQEKEDIERLRMLKKKRKEMKENGSS